MSLLFTGLWLSVSSFPHLFSVSTFWKQGSTAPLSNRWVCLAYFSLWFHPLHTVTPPTDHSDSAANHCNYTHCDSADHGDSATNHCDSAHYTQWLLSYINAAPLTIMTPPTIYSFSAYLSLWLVPQRPKDFIPVVYWGLLFYRFCPYWKCWRILVWGISIVSFSFYDFIQKFPITCCSLRTEQTTPIP